MAEAAKVRLVRCPQCENLLNEPPDFSVYQCGGCGAVLRAKKKGLLDDGISEEDKGGGVSGKGDINAGLISDLSAEKESNGVETGKVERHLNENGIFNSISSSATEDKGVLANSNRPRRGLERIEPRIDQNRKGMDDEYRESSKVSRDNLVRDSGTNCALNMKRPAYVNSNIDNGVEEDLLVGSLRSRPAINQKSVGRSSSVASSANANGVLGQRRLAKFPCSDEGPSNYGRGSLYNYGDYMPYGDHLDGLARVENLENDRAELLRKLDELADQLSRSCDVAEKPRERSFYDQRVAPPDTYGKHDAFMQEGTSISYGVNKQPLAPDKHVSRPPYFTHNHGYPFMDRHGSAVQEPYSSTNCMQEYRGFADGYQPQMFRRPSHQLPRQYFQESDYEHFPGPYMDFNQDLFMSHPHETFFHQAACSCMHCFNKNWHAPKMQPPNFSNQTAGSNYMHRVPYPPANPVAYGLPGYISEGSKFQHPHSRDRQHLTRSSSDLGRETGGFRHRLKKVVVSHGNGRVFHPVSGGAPFVTCCNCWELLKLPRKIMSGLKNHRKMKCGACSSILLFEIEGKGILVSVPVETEPVAANNVPAANEIPDENFRNSNDFSDSCALNTANDYDNFNYDFQLADEEPNPSLRERRSDFGASDTRQDLHSSSSTFSDDEESPDSLIMTKDVSHFSKDEACLTLSDSPSLEYPDHPSSDEVMQRNGQGNKSKRIDQDKNIQDGMSRQNSLKDSLVATEMEVSYNDHLSTVVSQDSTVARKDEDQSKTNKGGESFLVGLIKRRFGEFSRSSKTKESGRTNVSINGHFIPDRVLKKAEKLAGTIQPGEYWYDFRAGFWGVMGHPCLGIIPPNIDEFDYPMPHDCSLGNTGVFVNGRELHQKDLDLLVGRGLPSMRNKSYLIEISGRVVDEQTGEELDSLGKLAPTVERAKHGFGMKVPKSIQQQQTEEV